MASSLAPSLCVDGQAVARVEVATTPAARARGLLGRTSVDGALWLARTRSVHTFAMRMPIDVALLDGRGVVLQTWTLVPGRLVLPRPKGRIVVEAGAGSFATWDLRPGSCVSVR